MNVTRREVSRLLAFAAVAPVMTRVEAHAAAATAAIAPSNGTLECFNYGGVQLLNGAFKHQFQATRDTYFNIPDDSFLVGFRERAGLPAPGISLQGWYVHDVFNAFGQYLGGMSRMAKAGNDVPLRDKTLFLMNEWGKTIAPDGYFFYSRKPNAYHYFYEKMMGGLNDVYEYTGDKNALLYMDRITNWAIKNLDRTRMNASPADHVGGKAKGSNEWYTLSENLYRAYQHTGDSKYKTFAEVWHYNKYWDNYADGHPEVNMLHAYSHVNTLSSAAMAYEVSRNPHFLRTITNAYEYLQSTQCYATGGYGPGEVLLSPEGGLGDYLATHANTFETPCGTWAGFKLSRYLMRFTGDAHYGDWMERLAYNGIGSALPMKDTGETFYYSDYRLGGGTKIYNKNLWPCCSGTYPEAVADYHNIIYFKDADGLYVNLFVPSEVTWQHKDQQIVLRQETSYPDSEEIILTVTPKKNAKFPLHFRVPGWAKSGVTCSVNGVAQRVEVQPGKWATIKRTWKIGDKVQLHIRQDVTLVPVDRQHPNRVAVRRGPQVLVLKGQTPLQAQSSEWKMTTSGLPSSEMAKAVQNQMAPFQSIKKDESYFMYFDLKA